jgi:hypothetical protein
LNRQVATRAPDPISMMVSLINPELELNIVNLYTIYSNLEYELVERNGTNHRNEAIYPRRTNW